MTEKTQAEMVAMVGVSVMRLSADIEQALAELAEKNGPTMQHLAKRAEQVGAAEATAELFVALLAEHCATYSPTNIEVHWKAHKGFTEVATVRSRAAVRSITKFFNSWPGE